MTTLYLVRHGATAWNLSGRILGWHDEPLAAEGIAQAERLREEFRGVPFDWVVCSDLRRAFQTAWIIAGDRRRVPFYRDRRLREVHRGEWEGLTLEEIRVRFPEAYAAFLADPYGARPPGGESLLEAEDRARAFLRSLPPDTSEVLVVTHKLLARTLYAVITGARPPDLDLVPGTYIRLGFSPHRL